MKSLLFLLVSFIAVSALLFGILMVSVPDGSILNLPINILQGSTFKDFQIPGLVLLLIIGGINIMAIFYNLQRAPSRYNWSMLGGFLVIGWIAFQIVFIKSVVWFNSIYLVAGVLIILISIQLKGKLLV